MNSYMLPSGQRCAASAAQHDRRRAAARRRGRRARRPCGRCARRAAGAAPVRGGGSSTATSARCRRADQRRRLAVRSRGELPAVQHHREDVDADRGHVEAVAVEGELHRASASSFTCRVQQVRPEAVELLAVPRPVGAGEPADLDDRTAAVRRDGVSRAQNRRRRTVSEHSSPTSSAIAKTSTTSSAGVVADLQVHPLARRRRSAPTVPSSRRDRSGRAPGSRAPPAPARPESTLRLVDA